MIHFGVISQVNEGQEVQAQNLYKQSEFISRISALSNMN